MINSFSGQYRFLSNFYPSPIKVEDFLFPTAEHFYQAGKSMYPEEWNMIMECKTPGEAKRLGQKLTLREDWNDIRIAAMTQVIEEKFNQNPILKTSLLMTGSHELIEGNTWNDRFWGQCNGVGENHLGIILMKYRETLNPRG